MKSLLLSLACLILTGASAQSVAAGVKQHPDTIPAYVPYHVYLQHHYQNIADLGGTSRSIGPQVTYSHYRWVDSSVWVPSDSSFFDYNQQGHATYTQSFYYVDSSWNNEGRFVYVYDAHGNTLADTSQEWDTATHSWRNLYLATETYDANNNNTSLTEAYFVSYLGAFRNTYRDLYNYDSSNDQIAQLIQTWDTAMNVWVNANYDSTGFFAPGKESYYLSLNWNTGTSSWDTSYMGQTLYNNHSEISSDTEWNYTSGNFVYNALNTYTYDGNGNQLSYLAQSWYSGAWLNGQLTLNTFDAHNNQLTYQFLDWNSGSSAWDSINRYFYTYNSSNQRTSDFIEYYSYGLSEWLLNTKDSSVYDNRGNKTEEIQFLYNNAWVPYYEYQYTFNTNNQTTYELDLAYDTATQTFLNADEYFYYWPVIPENVINQTSNDIPATLYPNPASGDNVYLQFTLDAGAGIAITLFDAQGRLLGNDYQQAVAGANSILLRYPGLPPGTYFIQMFDRGTGKASVLQFVKQ